jgi:hypothetical protein
VCETYDYPRLLTSSNYTLCMTRVHGGPSRWLVLMRKAAHGVISPTVPLTIARPSLAQYPGIIVVCIRHSSLSRHTAQRLDLKGDAIHKSQNLPRQELLEGVMGPSQFEKGITPTRTLLEKGRNSEHAIRQSGRPSFRQLLVQVQHLTLRSMVQIQLKVQPRNYGHSCVPV